MIVKDNDYIKYDYNLHLYYPTELLLTDATTVNVDIWGMEAPKRLKAIGILLHQEQIKSRYNAKIKGMRHQDLIEYKIFKNEQNEVDALVNAFINFVELAEQNEADLTYRETGVMPETVLQPLRDANIYFKGEMIGYVPEEEYRDGY